MGRAARAERTALANGLVVDKLHDDLWPVYGALLINLRNVLDALDEGRRGIAGTGRLTRVAVARRGACQPRGSRITIGICRPLALRWKKS